MKTITLDIIKKNRKYFACKTSNGYKARLIIDKNSENLELGVQELPVNDKSVRSKYGTDIILELAADADEIKAAGIVTLSHHLYNHDLVEDCRKLGGKWDSEEGCWVFSDIVEDKVEELDAEYNTDIIKVEITAVEKDYDGDEANIIGNAAPVRFCGYTIAKATGRDSGAKIGEEISMIKGKIRSGGSMKNWKTVVEHGSVFRLKIARGLLEYSGNEWDVKILGE